MRYQTIGFIGCGNMGGALARCAAKNLIGSERILLSDVDAAKMRALCDATGAQASDNRTIAQRCDLIFLAIKPQMLAEVLEGIRSDLRARTDRFVLLSMVAGVPICRVLELSGRDAPIIRIMPNTPVSMGEGMVQYCHQGCAPEEVEAFLALLQGAGLFDELPEHLIDAASAVSGCGTAYLCLALEGMADGGVALGLPRDKALRYAAQTIAGLGKLALQSGLHPGVLKDQVTSPGGTTIQGVRALENYRTRAAFFEAVIASYEKTERLKQST